MALRLLKYYLPSHKGSAIILSLILITVFSAVGLTAVRFAFWRSKLAQAAKQANIELDMPVEVGSPIFNNNVGSFFSGGYSLTPDLKLPAEIQTCIDEECSFGNSLVTEHVSTKSLTLSGQVAVAGRVTTETLSYFGPSSLVAAGSIQAEEITCSESTLELMSIWGTITVGGEEKGSHVTLSCEALKTASPPNSKIKPKSLKF